MFHLILKPWLSSENHQTFIYDPSYWPSVAIFSGLVGALFITLGFVDQWERLYFARFAIGVVRDLRQAATHSALIAGQSKGSGDLVARIIGDTARMKAGLKGFLVHVATNGLLYVGATAILLTVNFYFGLLLVVAGLAIAAITAFGAAVVFNLSFEHRSREGKMANSLERKLAGQPGMMRSFKKHNNRSSNLEAAGRLSRVLAFDAST